MVAPLLLFSLVRRLSAPYGRTIDGELTVVGYDGKHIQILLDVPGQRLAVLFVGGLHGRNAAHLLLAGDRVDAEAAARAPIAIRTELTAGAVDYDYAVRQMLVLNSQRSTRDLQLRCARECNAHLSSLNFIAAAVGRQGGHGSTEKPLDHVRAG
jgi:hypothetical protein